MKLDRIELFHVVRPLDLPFRPSWVPGYVQPATRFTLLRVTTDDGHEVMGLHEMGFKTVKLRVHSFDIDQDIAQVAAVRRTLGDRMAIGVDANQAWRISVTGRNPIWSLDRAIDFAHACADLEVSWLEEPLDMHAYDELAEICRQSTVPIAGGEANNGWHEFKVMLEKGSYDIYQPDATFGGGVTDGWQVLRACCRRGLAFTPHTWTNGIGFMVNLHLYVAGDRGYPLEYPYKPPGWVPEVRDVLLAEPILVDADGKIPVPQGPGLGIELDEDQLAHYGEKFYDWSPG